MIRSFYLVLTALFFSAATLTAQKSIEFQNGHWYNGDSFSDGTWYAVKGLLTQKKPSVVDSVVDLQGRWVVPPLADFYAACLPADPSSQQFIRQYHNTGVHYVQILGNSPAQRQQLEQVFSKTEHPQAVYANGVITCTYGYPFADLEAVEQGILNPAKRAEQYDNFKQQRKGLESSYWFINNKKELDTQWPRILSKLPGVLSIYLLDSEKNGGKEGRGLAPDVAKALVKKAHKARLTVVAHVETPDDVRLALKIGVDGLANLPITYWDGTQPKENYMLGEEDWKKIIKKKIAIMPRFSYNLTPTPAVQLVHAELMKKMLSEGVNVVLGSGDPNRTLNAELTYWYQLGGNFKPNEGLDYRAMLRQLVQNTPQAIFPRRKIGKIQEGYEASFVVLSDSPLPNLLKIRLVSFQVKNGRVLPGE